VNCRELTTFVFEYYEGTLPRDDHAAFEFHLSRCPNCVRYLDSYRRTIDLARVAVDEGDAASADDLPEDLVQAILNAQRMHRPAH
jgi:anti-sigma factor RsiW